MKITAFIAVVAVGLLMAGCVPKTTTNAETGPANPAAKPPTRPAVLVSTSRSASGSVSEFVTVTGHVRAMDKGEVNTKITGRVERVAVREGDRVQKGQPVVWLDDKDLRAQVANARAAVASARSRLAQLQTGVGWSATQVDVDVSKARQGVLQAQAATSKARAEYDDAELDLKRKENLFKTDAIAQIERDSARLRFKNAVQGLKAARSVEAQAEETLRLARAGTTQTKMSQDEADAARAAVSQAEASLQSAEVSLEYAVLYAPIKGVVTARNVEPGKTVNPQQSSVLLSIVDNSWLELLVPVDEHYIPALHPGGDVEVTSEMRRGQMFHGHVREIVPTSDPTSHTMQIRLSISDSSLTLVDGAYVSARIKVRDHQGTIVPLTAVQERTDETYVMLVKDRKVEKHPVQVGYQNETQAVIQDGLQPGEEVVSTGAEALQTGQEIKVSEPSPAPKT